MEPRVFAIFKKPGYKARKTDVMILSCPSNGVTVLQLSKEEANELGVEITKDQTLQLVVSVCPMPK